jgi:type I restriction enzyme S subunit
VINEQSLPLSWSYVPIEDVAKINPRTFSILPTAKNLPVHFVSMSAVKEEYGGINVSTQRILHEVQKGYTSFLEDDVLFAKITPCMENGKLALVPHLENHIAFGSTEFHVLRATLSVSPKWLSYFLSQAEFRRMARHNMTGSAGQMRVSTNWLALTKIPVAPYKEQTRIITKLEELLTDLDAGVNELKTAQKKLTQYRQSLLKAAVEGALTAEWRANNTPSESGSQLLERVLKERRARWEQKQLDKFNEQGKTPPKDWQSKYSEPVKPDTKGLMELPEGWVWASMAQLCEIQGGIQKQPSRTPVLNKYPFLRVANVARSYLKLDEIHEVELFEGELERLALQKGDVLIVEGNGSLTEIGRCALWDDSIKNAVHQNHLIRARPVLMVSEFMETWLNSFRGIEQMTTLAATTSGLYTLSVGKISKIPVPVPPVSEQMQIYELLNVTIAEQIRQSAAIEISLKQSTAQRKNILKAAFSGQLVPQDPNDEPASVLLERIKAERVAQEVTKKPRQRSNA